MDNQDLSSKIQEAKGQGYTDTQIIDHLEAKDPRLSEARKAGHSDSDIIKHLTPAEKGYGAKVLEATRKAGATDNHGQDTMSRLKSVGEAGLNVVSNLAAPIAGVVTAQEGKTSAEKLKLYEETKNKYTYEPKTEGGKAITGAIGAITEPVAKAFNYAGEKTEQGLNAVGVDPNKSKLAHEVTSDFLPYALPGAAKGIKNVAKEGIALGVKAANDAVAVNPALVPGIQKALETGISHDVKMTKGQLEAAGERELGNVKKADKIMTREHEAAKKYDSVAEHYKAQARQVNKTLDNGIQELSNDHDTLIGQATDVPSRQAAETAKATDIKALKDFKKAAVVREKGTVISLDPQKMAEHIDKVSGEVSPQLSQAMNKVLEDAQNLNLPKPTRYTNEITGSVKDVIKAHKATGIAGAIAGAVGGPTAGVAAAAAVEGVKALGTKLTAKNFLNTSKFEALKGKPMDSGVVDSATKDKVSEMLANVQQKANLAKQNEELASKMTSATAPNANYAKGVADLNAAKFQKYAEGLVKSQNLGEARIRQLQKQTEMSYKKYMDDVDKRMAQVQKEASKESARRRAEYVARLKREGKPVPTQEDLDKYFNEGGLPPH
jgi:hypothetical protein